MYRSKADVDRHVEQLAAKLSAKELKLRSYSVARLYYEVGDYASCRRYVEEYISIKDNNAAAHKLLGQALQQLGQKEKALEQYKTSLDIDATQSSLLLNICELLADDEVFIDPGRARYWCDQAEASFPRHPATFRLRERLVARNPDPEAVIKLLLSEIEMRPKDSTLHARLLRTYLQAKNVKEAFNHSFSVEFAENNAFRNNYSWYEALSEVLSIYDQSCSVREWQYQLLKLTVTERLCSLSLNEIPIGTGKSLVEVGSVMHRYDQELQRISNAGPASGYAEFHKALLQHHRGQFSFYCACFLLKKGKKDQLNWREAARASSPLLLLAWHNTPLGTTVNWLSHASEMQQAVARRWHMEGSYRCSQAGHCLLSSVQDRSHTFVDRVSQYCSGTHWKDKLYEKLFSSREQLAQIKTSHFLSDNFGNPILRLPRKSEVQAFDADAQMMNPSSLHHIVWILINYKNYADFKCSLFGMLKSNCQNYSNCGPETLNKLDVDAFLYSAALTAVQHRKNASRSGFQSSDRPDLLPANITDLLCSVAQMKWWDCANKVTQNEVGTELSDIRVTLCRGIEVVRCVDNHGLDPHLLCTLGRIFNERAKLSTNVDDKYNLEGRANLYYAAAIPLLERIKNKMTIRVPEKRMFDYTHSDLNAKEVLSLIEESKLCLGVSYMNENEYEKAIETLSTLKSAQASFHVSQIYNKMAFEEIGLSKEHVTSEDRSKNVILLSKAKEWAYTTSERLKNNRDENKVLHNETQSLIEKIEGQLSRIDPDISNNAHDYDGKYSSDENGSSGDSHIEQMHHPLRTNNTHFRNISSTPKSRSGLSTTHYKSAMESHLFENTRSDNKHLERIESQIKNLHKKDASMNAFMEHTKIWIEENRNLGNEVRDLKKNLADKIINSINSNIQDTVDQFKSLKLSVDQVKDKIGEYRDECKTDVGDLKKEVADLKKEMNKLKKLSDQNDENDLYNLEEEYKATTSQLQLSAPPVLPPFNLQRMIHPAAAAYSLYGQDLYALYNQMTQPPQVPSTLFDATRAPVNYPGVYQPPEQMYPDVSQFLPPNILPASTPSVVPPTVVPPSVVPPLVVPPSAPPSVPPPSIVPPVTVPPVVNRPVQIPPPNKEIPRSLPVNVVITSSDPLPTHTSVPQPILSVTIPPEHIKSSPHNYQIPLPTMPSNMFNTGPTSKVVTNVTPAKPFLWNQPSSLNTTPLSQSNTPKVSSMIDSKYFGTPQTPQGGGAFGSPNVSFGLGASFTTSNTSLNKSRTLSEKSNTSVENYDPCPDFKPIIPLPAEIEVKTGEENEETIFRARAKLFRFVDKQWKERGLGEIKLLKHKATGKVRVLMRREQVHKICANHIITPEMDLQPMKNESKAYFWVANDFADETVVLEKFSARFKTAEIAKEFYDTFEKARKESKSEESNKKPSLADNEASKTKEVGFGDKFKPSAGSWTCTVCYVSNNSSMAKCVACQSDNPSLLKSSPAEPAKQAAGITTLGGFTFTGTPTFKPAKEIEKNEEKPNNKDTKPNLFSNLSFKPQTTSPFANIFNTSTPASETKIPTVASTPANGSSSQLNTSDVVEEFEPSVEFKPVVPMPALIEQKTGEEDEIVAFEHRSKLLRYDTTSKEWKERGLGNIKLLVHKDNDQKARLLMRREIVMKVCCNHAVTKELKFQKMPNQDKAVTWCARDFSEGEITNETFCLRFKTADICNDFIKAIETVQNKLKDGKQQAVDSKALKEEKNAAKQNTHGDSTKPQNLSTTKSELGKTSDSNQPVPVANWGDKFKPKIGSWECAQCFIRNEGNMEYCAACESPKDPNKPKKEPKSLFEGAVGTPKFSFGIPNKNGNNGTNEAKNVFLSAESASGETKTFSFGIKQSESVKLDKLTSPAFTATAQKPEDSSKTTPFTKFGLIAPNAAPFSTTSIESSGSFAKDSGTFAFVMKPKSANKSPMKSPQSDRAGDSDEYCSEDEGHHIHFTPVIPLPDKVEVTTGEENESTLYCHRAKLFRFVSGEWKERGLGDVKVMKHNDTGKLRVLMRREHIHKICLNHALTPDVTYTPKDEKTWLFIANDYSEGELNLQQFCLRFKSKEIALEFMNAVDGARCKINIPEKSKVSASQSFHKKDDSDDVLFVGEIKASIEEKQKAKELLLPENFYTYKSKTPCTGCRGCDEHHDAPKATDAQAATTPAKINVCTPNKNSLNENSPTNSIFVTPSGFNRSADTSIFRTPLETIQRNSYATDDDRTPTNETKNKSLFSKENSATPKSIFGGSGDSARTIFGSANQSTVSFGNKSGEPSSTIKAALLATPKLSIATSNTTFTPPKPEVKSIFGLTETSTEKKTIFGADQKSEGKLIFGAQSGETSETKSIFGGNQTAAKSIYDTSNALASDPKSIFGASGEQKSIFGFSTVQNTKPLFGAPTGDKTETKPEQVSIFGGTGQSNLFSGTKPTNGGFGSSIFGGSAITTQANTTLGSAQSIFANANSKLFGSDASSNKTPNLFSDSANTATQNSSKSIFGSQPTTKDNYASSFEPAKRDTKAAEVVQEPFPIDNSLSFAALSSNGPGIETQKKSDFQWEGAGQQLFVQKNPSQKLDKSQEESGRDESRAGGEESGAGGEESGARGEEEYDPHYEPIVPLPDKIVVTTGEEDEEKLFGERAKLFRYDDKLREWKERGVGEMKLLYHPVRKTYRLLLRREQIHKAVLNSLLHKDLELLPMNNSDRAWMWVGVNYAESPAGDMEKLAVRFKSVALTTLFKDQVVDAVRKLQAADAQAYREEQERKECLLAPVAGLQGPPTAGDTEHTSPGAPAHQVHFQEPEAEVYGEEGDEHSYEEYDEDYEDYYNEEEEQMKVITEATCNATVIADGEVTKCPEAHVQFLYDPELYTYKLFLTDAYTGEILVDTVVFNETPFEVSEVTLKWSGTDYTSSAAVEKTVSITFPDEDTCHGFFSVIGPCLHTQD